MEKISLKTSIYELSKEHPQLPEIMAGLGFLDILKPGMLNTVGKLMNLEKGMKLKKISRQDVESVFKEYGFELID